MLNDISPVNRRLAQSWWASNASHFILPCLYAAHKHDWVHLQAGCLGCKLCGVIHECGNCMQIVPCCVELQEDCSSVCMYSGVVITTNLLLHEHTNARDSFKYVSHTTQNLVTSSKKRFGFTERLEFAKLKVEECIHMLLYSDSAKKARVFEKKRYDAKVSSVFALSITKKNTNGVYCDILTSIEMCMNIIEEYRTPPCTDLIPAFDTWNFLIRNIVVLITTVDLPKPYSINTENNRIKYLILSLIYTASNGIHSHGTQYLAAYPLLNRILPLQMTLQICFAIQSKFITDGENFIKRFINTNQLPLQKQIHSLLHSK